MGDGRWDDIITSFDSLLVWQRTNIVYYFRNRKITTMDSFYLVLLVFSLLFTSGDSAIVVRRATDDDSASSVNITSEGDLPVCLERSLEDAYSYSYPEPTIVRFYFAIMDLSSSSPLGQHQQRLLDDWKTFLRYILYAAIDWCPPPDIQSSSKESTNNSTRDDELTGGGTNNNRLFNREEDADGRLGGVARTNTRLFRNATKRQQRLGTIVDIETESIQPMIHNCTCEQFGIPVTATTSEDGRECQIYQGTLAIYTSQQLLGDDDAIQLVEIIRNQHVRRILDEGLLLTPNVDATLLQWIDESFLLDNDCIVLEDEVDGQGELDFKEGTNREGVPIQTSGTTISSKNNNGNDFVPVTSPKQQSEENHNSGGAGQRFLVASGSMLLAGLGVFLLVHERRRLSVLFRPKRDNVLWNDFFYGIPPTFIGTGDPPSSYHYGQYHCMLTGGVRYLSTQCESCLETLQRVRLTNSSSSGGANKNKLTYSDTNAVVTTSTEKMPTRSDPALCSTTAQAHWGSSSVSCWEDNHQTANYDANVVIANLTIRGNQYQKKRDRLSCFGTSSTNPFTLLTDT